MSLTYHWPIAGVFFVPASPPVARHRRHTEDIPSRSLPGSESKCFVYSQGVSELHELKTPSRESLYNKARAKEDLLREQNKELQTYRLKDLCKDMVVGLNNSVDV
nr:hypothetical protein Itr_chr08CG15740 [Ipomoea trifida]